MVKHGYTWQASKINLVNHINVRDAFLRYCSRDTFEINNSMWKTDQEDLGLLACMYILPQ